MKKLITVGLLALFGIESFALAGRDGFIIANRGESPSCAIVIGADAAEAEKCAAGELQTFVRRMTGVELPVLTGKAAG